MLPQLRRTRTDWDLPGRDPANKATAVMEEIKMRQLGRCAFVCALVAMITLFLDSPVGRAQGVLAGSGDVAGTFGWGTLTGADGNKHINFGGSAGANLSPAVSVFGEYLFLPLGSASASDYTGSASVSVNNQQFGGGARFNFASSKVVVPYAVVAFGYAREGANATVTITGQGSGSGSAALNGDYVGFGGGAHIYLGKGLGVRPEFRYERQEFYAGGSSAGQNLFLVSGSLFYQFGGGEKKKKNVASLR